MSQTGIPQDNDYSVEHYQRNGFAVAQSVFSEQEITEVYRLLEPLFSDFSSKLGRKARDVGALGNREPGSRQPEIDRATALEPALFKTAVYAKAQSLASNLLMRPARYVFDHAISKMPHSDTSTAWHQDRGYMRPSFRLETVNLWIPLQPVNPDNGTLTYVPGSHRGDFIRHEKDPALHPHVLTAKVSPENTFSPALAVGDMCIHHPLTVHSAGPNKTDQPRLAWAVHFGAYGRMEYLKPSNLFRALKAGFRQH